MSTSQRVVKNTFFLYIRMGASILVNIFTTRILLEALGTSDYGLYNVVGGAIAMLGFVSASMSTATQRFLSYAEGEGERDKIKKIFNNTILIHRGIAALTIVILSICGIFFFNGILNIPPDKETVALVIYGCMLFSAVYSITVAPFDAVLNSHENMLYYSLLGIGDVVCKLLIAIAILYCDIERLIVYAVLMALEAWLLRLITQAYCRKHYEECHKIEIRRYLDKKTIREMTSFAGWNMTNVATGMISLFGMNIVINHYFGTHLNAAMGVATQLSGVLMGVSMNMIKAVTPVLVKKEGGQQREQMLEVAYIGCKYSYLLFSFLCIPVLFFMPFILDLWLVEVPEWTSVFCVILIISTLLDQLTVFLYQAISAEGHIRNYNVVRSITNILPIVISVMMFSLSDFPPYWVLINWIVGKGLIGGITNVYFSKHNIGMSVKDFIKKVFLPCVRITSIMAVVCWGIVQLEFNNLCLLAFSFTASIPFYWIFALSRQEKEIFQSIALSLKRK